MTRIRELWRYPVASVGGESVDEIMVGAKGVDGDREYMLVDLVSGEIAAPEKLARWRPALELVASHRDGGVLAGPAWSANLSDPALDDALSTHFGFPCGIRRLGAVIEIESGPVMIQSRYDVSPLHIVSSAAIEELQTSVPGANLDVRRFRPNIVVDEVFRDDEVLGRPFTAGVLKGTMTEATRRCGMTMIPQIGLPEDPEILRTIVRKRARCFGVYATVSEPATISVGDKFCFVDPD
ncbi:MOSC domain-containing protein [Rhizobium sp. 2MFCol3.1]|uniref:MOSC domain-containing protein n=1 Tax=Rhizobium sp. 2MFCol3.1 TaxID=1246459 RepID=UPI000476CDC5|nr:MOSC domain-containing protein [Rhizobium sp. 2MFCol3.1]